MNRYKTILTRFESGIRFITFNRPEVQNAINERMLSECAEVLEECGDGTKVLVLEGSKEVFCSGADLKEVKGSEHGNVNPEPVYRLWTKLTKGDCVSVAHVQGKVQAGGIGFVAACDIVLANDAATFVLPEMLFGLLPACVLPFLIRRIGFQRAQYLTLTTQFVGVDQAHQWGLVDAYHSNSDQLLRKHLLRLGKLSKNSIARYRRYVRGLENSVTVLRDHALNFNREVFTDPDNLKTIARFTKTGLFPWEE